MKPFRITLLLLYATLLSTCVGEDKCCPTDRNVVVEFAYVYDGYDVFGDQIYSVNLFVFDSDGLLTYSTTIYSEQLNTFAGTTLNHLAPGNYRIVAWGNATPQRSVFGNTNEGDHIDDTYVGRYGVLRYLAPQPGDADRLHFAPHLAQEEFTITIPRAGDLTVTLPFARAHIDIEVFVINFELYSGETDAPVIEIDGVSSHFDFDRVPFGDITLRETAEIQDQYVQRPAVAHFRTKLFDDNDNFTKELRVKGAEGDHTVYFILDNVMFRNLIAEFMVDNNIQSLKADATPQRVIPITIVFSTDGRSVEVGVRVPEFEVVGGRPWF